MLWPLSECSTNNQMSRASIPHHIVGNDNIDTLMEYCRIRRSLTKWEQDADSSKLSLHGRNLTPWSTVQRPAVCRYGFARCFKAERNDRANKTFHDSLQAVPEDSEMYINISIWLCYRSVDSFEGLSVY